MPKRLGWELILLASGVTYVLVALFAGLESIGFVILFVVLSAKEMVLAHREERRNREGFRIRGRQESI